MTILERLKEIDLDIKIGKTHDGFTKFYFHAIFLRNLVEAYRNVAIMCNPHSMWNSETSTKQVDSWARTDLKRIEKERAR